MHMRKILIRFDDICPTMDFEEFDKAKAILEKYDIKPLLGVIPKCEDTDLFISEENKLFWGEIIAYQKKGYTIAMHGYTHSYDSSTRGIINDRFISEFAGHPYEVQYDKIRKGKKILNEHGVETDVFFAPAHSYDKNTIKALAANGFKYISDGKSHKMYKKYGITFLPCKSGGVPQIKKNGIYTAIFHVHEWKRADKAEAYNQLIDLCEKYYSDIVDFEDYIIQKRGLSIIQWIDERIYVLFQQRIKGVAKKILIR